MAVNSFSFFRGAAAIMAEDLATSPVIGSTTQLCGDAHAGNFGLFGSLPGLASGTRSRRCAASHMTSTVTTGSARIPHPSFPSRTGKM